MAVFKDKIHLMKQLKLRLGIYGLKLPMSDSEIYEEVILGSTLGEFSMYNADVKTVMLDTEEDFDKEYKDPMRQNNTFYGVNRRSMVLRLPKLHDRDIMTIASCNPYIDYGGITSNAYMETMESFQSLALTQEAANLSTTMAPPFTFEFIPPDKIRIFNFYSYGTKLACEIHYVHHKELYTIPMSARESFFKLALFDMKIFIYNNLRQYMNIETAHGKVDLKIDEWSSAESDKASMLEKWDDTYHFDKPAIFFI